MKNNSNFLSIGMVSILLCVLNFSTLNMKDPKAITYYLNGNKISMDSIKETEQTVEVFVNPTTCYVFENENNFLIWLNKPETNKKLLSIKKAIKIKHDQIKSFLMKARESGIIDNESELDKLYNKIFQGEGNKDVVLRGLGYLYEHINYAGLTKAFGKYSTMPSGWDNRASSANVTVSTGLFDKTYFRGTSRWLAPGTYPNFLLFGFNDKTSSVF